jgi:hypothetical protein
MYATTCNMLGNTWDSSSCRREVGIINMQQHIRLGFREVPRLPDAENMSSKRCSTKPLSSKHTISFCIGMCISR